MYVLLGNSVAFPDLCSLYGLGLVSPCEVIQWTMHDEGESFCLNSHLLCLYDGKFELDKKDI